VANHGEWRHERFTYHGESGGFTKAPASNVGKPKRVTVAVSRPDGNPSAYRPPGGGVTAAAIGLWWRRFNQ